MNHKNFESEYAIGELVEYKQDRNDEYNLFGFVVKIAFYKSDSVNYCAAYDIEKCNMREIDIGIYQHNIIKGYRPS